ncbi:TPA: hypothetical protein KV183_001265 [Morganella morganii]|nr:hypothetical protein [Morganella morganii]
MSPEKITEKMKSLDYLQSIIERMSKNSNQIKYWSITVVTGFVALVFNKNLSESFIIALFPVCIAFLFGFIDSYYLHLERIFRGVYSRYSFLSDDRFNYLNYDDEIKYQKKQTENKHRSCFISKIIFWFYTPMAIISFVIIAI